MSQSNPHHVFIRGITPQGKTFRPSDWAERLCRAIARLRADADRSEADAGVLHWPYAYCEPQVRDGIAGVRVDQRLREIDPLAWEFLMKFVADNKLQLVEAGVSPGSASADGR